MEEAGDSGWGGAGKGLFPDTTNNPVAQRANILTLPWLLVITLLLSLSLMASAEALLQAGEMGR